MSSPVPRVVIVGAGFGGLETAFGLKGAGLEITLIDRRNHHAHQFAIAAAQGDRHRQDRPTAGLIDRVFADDHFFGFSALAEKAAAVPKRSTRRRRRFACQPDWRPQAG